MSRWPVVDPPKPPLRTNLGGAQLASPKQPFDGPLNVLIALQGAAQGAVEASKTKQAYDEIPAPAPTIITTGLDDDGEDRLADG
ncbi:hypothetical protein ABIG06_006260 [Bradyrhizobium sp. USDA 326]|uniref:hypothetical protein n=1 Tax=unclassified Bradyrhizobium TaxID=2631580 RepID=UPI0035131B44